MSDFELETGRARLRSLDDDIENLREWATGRAVPVSDRVTAEGGVQQLVDALMESRVARRERFEKKCEEMRREAAKDGSPLPSETEALITKRSAELEEEDEFYRAALSCAVRLCTEPGYYDVDGRCTFADLVGVAGPSDVRGWEDDWIDDDDFEPGIEFVPSLYDRLGPFFNDNLAYKISGPAEGVAQAVVNALQPELLEKWNSYVSDCVGDGQSYWYAVFKLKKDHQLVSKDAVELRDFCVAEGLVAPERFESWIASQEDGYDQAYDEALDVVARYFEPNSDAGGAATPVFRPSHRIPMVESFSRRVPELVDDYLLRRGVAQLADERDWWALHDAVSDASKVAWKAFDAIREA